jgi:two-component system chemotaxis response regulator CheY
MKILIAEDDPVSRRLLEVTLRKFGYDVIVTSNGNEALKSLQGPSVPSLVISDWMMPGMDGLELCRNIRKMKKSSYTYIIILTAKGEKEDVIKGLDAGADDFLIKPFNSEELKYRVRIGERIINLEQRILKLATTDSLTGVLNRRAFMERMEKEIQRAKREESPISLILMDIDHFKKINDTYGHQAGDLVLQRVTDQLTDKSRAYDFVGRYGGEEFVICVLSTENINPRSIAERMRGNIEAQTILIDHNTQPLHITASFGVGTCRPGSEDGLDDLIKRTDKALYEAKNSGRNRVCLALEE